MLIDTKFLGEIEIKESEIITFEQGLPGFPDNMKFILLALDSDLPLALLQSTEQKEIGFVIAYPFAFKQDYAFNLNEEDKEQLQVENVEDVLVYAIVTLKETFEESTLNLLAPVVINNRKKLGKQIVLQDNAEHPLRYSMNVEAVEGSAK
jgi:flagellar assembly factor FliW